MYSKAELFNLALGALLLSKEISDPETDVSVEGRTLRKFWPTALKHALFKMNLKSTSTAVPLELVKINPNDHWRFAYRYPANCARFRRIVSQFLIDTPETEIPKETGDFEKKPTIFTNHENAIGEIVRTDISLNTLSEPAGMAIAYTLARMCIPLVTGKGATALKKSLQEEATVYILDAQQLDAEENARYLRPEEESEFVAWRMD